MKKLILILLSFVAFNLGAQEKIEVKREEIKKNQQKLVQGNDAITLAKNKTKKLTKQLDLSTKQQERVYNIFLDHFQEELKNKQKIKKLINSKNKGNKEEIKQKIAQQKSGNRENLDTKLKDVLTEEQYKTYQKKAKALQKTNRKD